MLKNLRITFTVVVILLCCGFIFAQGPIMKPLPDVLIGDREDNIGPVDLNMFRFSDAFDLDDYADYPEEEPPISDLIWSFKESDAIDRVEVNGITQLLNPADALHADLLGKDIRHAAAPFDDSLVDFWDLLDSPRGSGPPFQGGDPLYEAQLSEVVTFYVSDGFFVDSNQCLVQAVTDGFDTLSAPPDWIHWRTDDFEFNTNEWVFLPVSANAPDKQFQPAFSGYNGSAISISTDDTTNRFSFWYGPAADIYTGDLYRFTWTLTTDQTNQDLVPTARLRVGNGEWSHEMEIGSSGISNPNAPTSLEKDYRQYIVLPLGAFALPAPSFDVYDFTTPGDMGTVRLEELNIDSWYIPSDTWTADTVPAFGNWAPVNGPGVYNNITTGTTGGLQLGSTIANSFHFGFWGTLSGAVKFQPTDMMYRAVFTISSSDTQNPWCMVRVGSQDYQVACRMTAYTPVQPDSDGNEYALYFRQHEIVPTLDGFDLFFELGDFEANKGGTLTLTNVKVEHIEWEF